jgi:hypothetical protein
MMHGKEDPKLRVARGIQDFQHMGDAVVGLCNGFDARPDLAAFGNEVVIRINHQQSGAALVILRDAHGVSSCPLRILFRATQLSQPCVPRFHVLQFGVPAEDIQCTSRS